MSSLHIDKEIEISLYGLEQAALILLSEDGVTYVKSAHRAQESSSGLINYPSRFRRCTSKSTLTPQSKNGVATG